jgi:hypothetical protein
MGRPYLAIRMFHICSCSVELTIIIIVGGVALLSALNAAFRNIRNGS